MNPAFSSLKTCVVIAFSALLLASSLASTALAKFPRVPSAAPLKFHQDGTDLCLHARWSDAVLKDCVETNLGRQVWEHRPDFTLYNASRDRCLYRQSDTELGLAKCDGADSAQQWRIAFVDGAYEIGPLDAPDRCVATAGDSDLQIADCGDALAVTFDFSAVELPLFAGGELPPPNTGTLRNIRQIAPEGFMFSDDKIALQNKYAWSMAQYGPYLVVGTLNAATKEDVYEFTEGVAINSNGAEVWFGETDDGGATWTWNPSFQGGLFDKNNFGVRKMISCGPDLLAVYMNNAAGFGLLRYDGEWSVEFSLGGPTADEGGQPGMQVPGNVSGRGMAVFDDAVYLGIVNTATAAKIWRRPIDADCAWTGDWEIVTDDGFGFDEEPNKNAWFGDMTVFDGQIYAGTLNDTGGQIWRSSTGDPGAENWEKVYDARVLGKTRDVNMIKLHVFDGEIVAGTENQLNGAELLASPSGDEGTWEPLFQRGMTGDRRNTYVWYVVTAFDRLYTFWGTDFPGYHAYSMANLDGEVFDTETTNAFNATPLYYGGRSALAYQPPGDYDPLLIMGTATPDTDKGLRVYAADHHVPFEDPAIRKGELPGPEGPVACLSRRDTQPGDLMNNGQSWLRWTTFGNLELRVPGVGEILWETETRFRASQRPWWWWLPRRELCFQEDGNLVIKRGRRILWQSDTAGEGERLVLTDQCNLVITDRLGAIVWQSETSCP